MMLIIHATNEAYRTHIQVEENQGRLPLARFTWGHVDGHGWAFVAPWAQQALFPNKGTVVSSNDPAQTHEPFSVLRFKSYTGSHQHKNHDYEIEGRYWRGWVWRASWGKWWRLASWRPALLDPDIILHDPGQADDWGDRPGEDW